MRDGEIHNASEAERAPERTVAETRKVGFLLSAPTNENGEPKLPVVRSQRHSGPPAQNELGLPLRIWKYHPDPLKV